MPGVVRIFTAADLPNAFLPLPRVFPKTTIEPIAHPVFAAGRVLYVGAVIAAVVAESRAAAEDAAEQISVDLEPLDVLVDPREARSGRIRLHDNVPDNTLIRYAHQSGDVATAFARATTVIQRTIRLPRVAITPMEPAEGHFNHIASVQYEVAAVPEALSADEDGDVGTGVSAPEPDDADAPRVNTTPNIKRKADSAGSAGSSSEQNVPKAVPVRRVGIFNRGSSQETKPSDPAPSGGGFFRKLFR
jgi:hypothetical protein